MKRTYWIATAMLVVGGVARAATLGEVGMHDSLVKAELTEGRHGSLFQADMLDRWSVGGDYVHVNRPITMDNGTPRNLEARVSSFQLGVDLAPWLMLFGTCGSSESRLNEAKDYDNSGLKWSGGLRVNWWHVDIKDPTFLAGRISLQSNAEYTLYQMGKTLSWNEGYGDLTAHYEVFVNGSDAIFEYPYSIVWYGGVAASALDGKSGGLGFSEEDAAGLVGGMDVYLSHNLAVGVQVQAFGDASIGASLRYHF